MQNMTPENPSNSISTVEWFSLENSKPPESGYYLLSWIWIVTSEVDSRFSIGSQFVGEVYYEKEDDEFYDNDENYELACYYKHVQPTHWGYLPKSPQLTEPITTYQQRGKEYND